MGRFSRKNKEAAVPTVGKDVVIDDPAKSAKPSQEPPSLYDGPRASEASMDKTKHVQQQVDEVTGIMNKNVDSMLERGENLNDLTQKTEQLQQSSQQFSKNAAAVKRKLWWKNVKLGIIVASVILMLVIAAVTYGVITSKKDKKQ